MATSYKNIKPSNLFNQLKTEQHIQSALQSKAKYLKLFTNLQNLPAINKTRNNRPILWTGIINEKLIRNSNNLVTYKKALIYKKIQEVIKQIKEVKNNRVVYNYPKHPKGKTFNLSQLQNILMNFPNLQRALNKKLAKPSGKTFYVSNLPMNEVTLNNLKHREEVYRDPTGYFYFKPSTIQSLLKHSKTGKIRVPQSRLEFPKNNFSRGQLYNLRLAGTALKRSKSRSFGRKSST